MKKKVTKILAVMVAGTVLTACGSEPEGAKFTEAAASSSAESTGETASGEAVTITFWDENAGDGRSEIYADMIRDFESENPGIHIEYLGLTQADASAKYQTAIQAGETPDVGGAVDDWVGSIVQQDVCVPLNDYFQTSGLDKSYNQGVLKVAMTYHPDGQLYYIPKTTNINGFWINNELFDAKGLEIPANWEEVFSDIETLNDPGNGVYGIALRGGASSASELVSLMYSYSGVDSMFKDGKCTIEDPLHVEFAQKFKEIYGKSSAESDITAGYKEIVAAFDSGSAAMIYHNLGSYNTHLQAFEDNSKFTFVPYPDGASGKYTYDGSGTSGLVMFNSCKNKDAAWKWIEYILSHKGNSYWNEKAGQIPVNNECMEDDWLNDAPHIKTALEALDRETAVAVPKPEYMPGYASILSTEIEPLLQSMLTGDVSPEEFIHTYNDALQEEYDNYRKTAG